MILLYTGVVVIGVGLLFMIFGLFVGWNEAKDSGKLSPVSDFVDSLSQLINAIADKKFSTILFSLGILLIFLGGVIAGVGGLTQ